MNNHDYTIHLFTTKLENILVDPVIEYFVDIAHNVRKTKSSEGNLKQFQLCLREIKNWADEGKDERMLDDIMIKKDCKDYFQKLLQGIFQHHIEDILRKRGKDPSRSLRIFQIPKGKNFVHKVYLDFAKDVLWIHPQYIFDITKHEFLRDQLRKIIINTIHDFIPFQKLLDESSIAPKLDAIDIRKLDHDSLNDLLLSLPNDNDAAKPPNDNYEAKPIPLRVVPENKKVSSLFQSFENDFLGGLGFGGQQKDKPDGKLF